MISAEHYAWGARPANSKSSGNLRPALLQISTGIAGCTSTTHANEAMHLMNPCQNSRQNRSVTNRPSSEAAACTEQSLTSFIADGSHHAKCDGACHTPLNIKRVTQILWSVAAYFTSCIRRAQDTVVADSRLSWSSKRNSRSSTPLPSPPSSWRAGACRIRTLGSPCPHA